MIMSKVDKITKTIRHHILTSTSAAGSGHPTSSLSATDLMAELWFGGWLKYDINNPKSILNDRVIFSKGHAAPLLYALYTASGYLSQAELKTLRKFDSVIEGHPTPRFEPIEVATGSLGQGLSIGLGMAMARNLRYKGTKGRVPHVYVLLGDSEMAEGQVWEAIQLAGHYQVSNLVGIIDVNRLGQRGETMDAWNVDAYAQRVASFNWKTIILDDGHDLHAIRQAFQMIAESREEGPTMIIAKTQKGHGVSALADKDNWHGKALPPEELEKALQELGDVDPNLTMKIEQPQVEEPPAFAYNEDEEVEISYEKGSLVATREAYGTAINALGKLDPRVVVLDAETSNSTFAEVFKKDNTERFFEMYIAEQNMASAALGFDKTGYIPFISSFSAFFARAFDQIRMAQYAEGNLKVIGTHAGVSIGQDGSSQMGLEDISMFRSLLDSVVLYPSDAVSTEVLFTQVHNHCGISYMRLTREKTPVLYDVQEEFRIGGSKVLHESDTDTTVIIAAGITLHESLKAFTLLKEEGISVSVVDAYSIKPLDAETITRLAKKTGKVIVVEDHYPYGGLGEAVKVALQDAGVAVPVTHLAVRKNPRSGSPAELLAFEEIDSAAIVKAIKG